MTRKPHPLLPLYAWFYPFLFALYPIVSLYAHNAAEVSIGDIVRPLLLSLLFVPIITVFLFLIRGSENYGRPSFNVSFLFSVFYLRSRRTLYPAVYLFCDRQSFLKYTRIQ